MENKSSGNRFGRFWWLWMLCAIMSIQFGLALQSGEGVIKLGTYVLIFMSPFAIGLFLYNKATTEDNKNNISITPFRNIFLPWPKPAIFLAILVVVELFVTALFFAYTFYPCSSLDVIRKVNGCVGHIPHQSLVKNIAFSKDGKTFATSEFRGDVKVWSYPDLILLNNLGDGWPSGAELSLSSNGQMIAICGYRGATSILETRTGKILHVLVPQNDNGCDIAFAPDDNSVFIISETEIQNWDVPTGNLSQSITQNYLEYLEVSDDGNLLATGSRTGLINIRSTSDGAILISIQQPYLQSLAFSHDGQHILTAGLDISSIEDDSKPDISIIKVWNIKTGKVEYTKTLQDIRVEHMASSRNSDSFVGEESCFRHNRNLFEAPCFFLWKNINDQEPIGLKVPNIYSLIFSPTDGRILIGSYENIYIWQVP